MREIKFRGFCKDKGRWLYGSLLNNAFVRVSSQIPCTYIFDGADDFDDMEGVASIMDESEVETESVGQYTSLKDRNGVEIYEGDIVLAPSGTCIARTVTCAETGETLTAYKDNPPNQYVIHNVGYAFTLGTQDKPDYAGVLNNGTNKRGWQLEVIGNIYQHPELLKP